MFISALITGFLNSLKGRGLAEQYGLVYSKYTFLAAMCALIFLENNSLLEAVVGFVAFGIVTWTGSGGMMQAFTGEWQPKKEFAPVDVLVSKIINIRGWGQGYSPAEYRKFGVWYVLVISIFQALIAVISSPFHAPLLLLSGFIVGAMRYLPAKYSLYSWLICEIILGTITFISVIK